MKLIPNGGFCKGNGTPCFVSKSRLVNLLEMKFFFFEIPAPKKNVSRQTGG